MINVSQEFIEKIQNNTDFKENAIITFLNGTVLELSESDFTISNNKVTDAAGANTLPLGIAVSRQIQIELANYDDRFSVYDFYGAKIRLYLTYQLTETKEKIEFGTFTVVSPETYGTTIIITAQDDMYKADKEYSTSLTFPQPAEMVLMDICSSLDIPLATTTFLNGDFVIDAIPAGNYTYRQIIGYIAMLACGNARINRIGYLEIKTYSFPTIDTISGGTFEPWTDGDTYSGGTFNPWTTGDVISGTATNDYHVLHNFTNLKVSTDDVIITGVASVGIDEERFLVGNEGYVIEVENPLFGNKRQEAVALMANVLIGAEFRPFQADHIAYPMAEFMDVALLIDRKNNVYKTVITDVDFNFFGYTTLKNSAEPTLRNNSKFLSDTSKAFQKTKELVEKEKTDREQAVEKLNQSLSEASGLYVTEVQKEDGSTITYWHDKKEFSSSQNVIMATSEAIGFSNDGGNTFPYGITFNGATITRELYAEKIDGKYIKAETIEAESLAAKSVTADKISVDDLEALNALIGGWSISEDGIYASAEYEDESGFDVNIYHPKGVRKDGSEEVIKFVKRIPTIMDGEDVIEIRDTIVLYANGETYFYEPIKAENGVVEVSDERKKNIDEWDSRLDEFILRLPPICYELKDDKDHKLQTGIGAQTALELLEELGIENSALVHGDEKSGYSVNYRQLHAMEISLIQKQQKIIKELENKVSYLMSVVN